MTARLVGRRSLVAACGGQQGELAKGTRHVGASQISVQTTATFVISSLRTTDAVPALQRAEPPW